MLVRVLRVVSMLAPLAIGYDIVYAWATRLYLFHTSADSVLSNRLNCMLKPTLISGAYHKLFCPVLY